MKEKEEKEGERVKRKSIEKGTRERQQKSADPEESHTKQNTRDDKKEAEDPDLKADVLILNSLNIEPEIKAHKRKEWQKQNKNKKRKEKERSTNPIVGTVRTMAFGLIIACSMVVLPALSNPSIKIRYSFLPAKR